jgi:hypothetical protein
MLGKFEEKNFSIDPLAKLRNSMIDRPSLHGQIASNEELIESFWNTPIDFNDPAIVIDHSPFVVMENTSMSKIHFLFIMLNISQLTVIKKGVIKGVITKHEFIKKRRNEDVKADT